MQIANAVSEQYKGFVMAMAPRGLLSSEDEARPSSVAGLLSAPFGLPGITTRAAQAVAANASQPTRPSAAKNSGPVFVGADPLGTRAYRERLKAAETAKTEELGRIALLFANPQWGRNTLNEDVSYADAQKNWVRASDEDNALHRFGKGNEGNIKYISPDGHSEIVFDRNVKKVTDPRNMGTYNYFDPRWLGGVPHTMADVLPYLAIGNSYRDIDNLERFPAAIKGLKEKFGGGIKSLLSP